MQPAVTIHDSDSPVTHNNTLGCIVDLKACMSVSGPRPLLPSYLPATTPIPPTSLSKGFQWGAGRTTPLPLNENTPRWSGLEKRPCSSQKSQVTTDASVEGQTSQRSKSRPFRSSAHRPMTFTPPTPTPPISFSQPKPHPPPPRLHSIVSGPHNPETHVKTKKPPKTPNCLRRTGRTCTSTTRLSSGMKPAGTSMTPQKGPALPTQQRRLCLSPTLPRR